MKVHEIMTTQVIATSPDADLARAADLMREHDCGVLPVVDAGGHVTGMITDRDICRAVATHVRPPTRICVDETISHRVYSVGPDADVTTALQLMKSHQVRRLPVLDDVGRLKGIVSMNDVVLRAHVPDAVDSAVILDALKGICAHKHVELV